MPVTESERLTLHEQLAEKIGPEPAGTLMNQLPRVDSDELATKTDLRQIADKMATKDDLRQMADKMATKDDLRLLGDQLRTEMSGLKSELRGEMHKEFGEMHKQFGEIHKKFGEMRAHFAEQQTQLIATMTGQHRMTMLALVGVFVAMMASVLIPLLTSSPA